MQQLAAKRVPQPQCAITTTADKQLLRQGVQEASSCNDTKCSKPALENMGSPKLRDGMVHKPCTEAAHASCLERTRAQFHAACIVHHSRCGAYLVALVHKH